jgi:competence protein ComEC
MKNFKQYFKLYFLLFLIIINLAIFYAVLHTSPDKMKVDFLDVGQGDAIFVTAPGGVQMLIDGGPDNSVLRELGRVMPFYDRSIDVVVASHADQDHIGGLVEVLKRFKVDLLIRPNTTSTSAVYQELGNLIKSKNIKEEIIIKPKTISLGRDTEFDILFPNQNTAGWETNDSSVVGKLVYGNNSFLFTGDLPLAVEKYLVGKYGDFLITDVLKVGHHGSKNSSSEIFIETVAPAYSVISVGLDNRYGHPSPEAIKNLTTFGGQILKTMDMGDITFWSDGENISI